MTCKEVSTLMSRGEVAQCSLMQRLAVRVHLVICRRCRALMRQLEVITARARAHAQEQQPARDFEARLVRRLRDERPR